jgi:hypothetical protein
MLFLMHYFIYKKKNIVQSFLDLLFFAWEIIITVYKVTQVKSILRCSLCSVNLIKVNLNINFSSGGLKYIRHMSLWFDNLKQTYGTVENIYIIMGTFNTITINNHIPYPIIISLIVKIRCYFYIYSTKWINIYFIFYHKV